MNIEAARLALNTDNPDLLVKALKAIGAAGKLSDLQAVMALVKFPHESVGTTAADATCSIIRENLIIHYNDLEPTVREKLGLILQSLDPFVVEAISKDLYGTDDDRRVRAVQILGLLKKNPKIRDIIQKLLKHPDVKVRATAVNLLGRIIGPADNHELILLLLNDSDKRVRANTVEAIESLGNKRLLPILLRFRYDRSNRIRANVLKAMYSLGFTDIIDDLKTMLNDPNHLMKASALWVISQIKIISPELEDLIGFFLLWDNAMIRSNARKALEAIDSPRARGYLMYLKEDNNKALA